MRQARVRVFASIALLLLLGVAAQGQYIRPVPTDKAVPPTDADLVSREGDQKTVTVQLLNLTPYEIQLKDTNVGGSTCYANSLTGCPSLTSSSVTEADQAKMMNNDRTDIKSFMFAPVGIPRFIPKTPDQAFEPATMPCPDDSTKNCPNPNYEPSYRNTQSRPYSMVFSWDDNNGYVKNSWVKWTVKGVKYCVMVEKLCHGHSCNPPQYVCQEHSQDVDLGLWIDRIQPTTTATSGWFSLVSGGLFTAFHSLALVFEFENPMAWIEEFVAMGEFAKGLVEFKKENGDDAENDDGEKVFLASYTIPTDGSVCGSGPKAGLTCSPDAVVPIDEKDAVDAGWKLENVSLAADGTAGGPAALVVTTQVLRGLNTPSCPSDSGNYNCTLGRAPIFMITVMRAGDWETAKLACISDPDCGNGTYHTAAAPASGGSAASASAPDSNREKIRLFFLQAGAGRIAAALHRSDRRTGLLALAAVLRELPPADLQVLREMVRDALASRIPSKQERDLVHGIGVALERRLK